MRLYQANGIAGVLSLIDQAEDSICLIAWKLKRIINLLIMSV